MNAKSEGIVIEIASGGYLRIDPVSPSTMRIRLHETTDFPESMLERYGIIHSRHTSDYVLDRNGSQTTLRTGQATLTIDPSNGCLTVFDRYGNIVTQSAEPSWSDPVRGFGASFVMANGEKWYGLGDTTRERIQHRGYRAQMWVENVNQYAPIPFLMSSKKWGLLVNTTWKHEINIGHTCSDRLSFGGASGNLDYFLFIGDTYASLLDLYTDVAGKPSLLPIWAYGLTYVCHQHVNAREMVDDAFNFRRADIPCSMIGLEPGWMDSPYSSSLYKDWHPERFPLPPYSKKSDTFIGALDKLGFKLSLWLNCGHDLSSQEAGFEAADVPPSSDAYLTLSEGSWYTHLRKFVDQGVRAFKLSGASVALGHSGWLRGNGNDFEERHNLYPNLIAQQLYAGYKEHTGLRPMIYMADGYTGMQKFAATWSGKTEQEASLVSMLNHGMSGHVHTTGDMDVSTPEGIHFGFFQPWSQVNSWAYWRHPCLLEHDLLQTFKTYAKLRYSLLPYIYTAAHIAARTGMPILRAMPLVFPEDPKTDQLLRQYMFGDYFLTAVYTNRVYLPEGAWIDYWTGEWHTGPKEQDYTAAAPASGPLFVRAGAIVPVWPESSFTSLKQPEKLGLHLYLYGDSEYTLIEDDGITFRYLELEVVETKIDCKTTEKLSTVKIGARTGRCDGMPTRRRYDLFLHVQAKPLQVTVGGNLLEETGHPLDTGLASKGWYFDRTAWLVHLLVEEPADRQSGITIEVYFDVTLQRGNTSKRIKPDMILGLPGRDEPVLPKKDHPAIHPGMLHNNSPTHDTSATNANLETRLQIGLETGDSAKSYSALEEWWAERIERIPSMDDVRANLLMVCGLFVQICNRQGWTVHAALGDEYDHFIHIQAVSRKEQAYVLLRRAVQRLLDYRRTAIKKNLHPLIQQITEIVEKEIDGEMTLHTMAERLHVNSSHLSRMFKQAVGQSFTDYVVIRKMERAKAILIAGCSVSETALLLGYKDTSHFIRVFRKYWGVTPGELKV